MVVEELPENPWLVFVADLPLWLTKKHHESPYEFGQFARANQKIDVEGKIEHSKTPHKETIIEILRIINSRGAGITRIRWNGCLFSAFSTDEPSYDWKNCLPSGINGFATTYIWKKIPTVEKRALLMKVPPGNITDDTRYRPEQLRPGIMIGGSPNKAGATLSTTSGVCVQIPASANKFITVAARGFPIGVGELVYHPRAQLSSSGQCDPSYQIATLYKKFEDTNITLAQLLPRISYSGETFSDPEPGQPATQPFRSLKDLQTMCIGDTVFMNTPFNIQCERVHVGTDWLFTFAEATDGPDETPTHFEIVTLSYCGNDSDIFFDGCSGAVIWDENFDVLGRFYFQEKDGLNRVFAPSFSILINQGYQLSAV